MTSCRLLIDPPAAGAWNMAVDELMLESASSEQHPCWRFYRWEEPTLSLGYFQTCEDRGKHPSSVGCPVVRRASGGGAILHDLELTYSVAVPAVNPWTRRRRGLYEIVHTTLIEVLAQWGVDASLAGESATRTAQPQPFLCFLRRAPGDVLVGTAKIAGSAQRRARGAVLQHGSILLDRSPAAPELEGLRQVAGVTIEPDQLVEAWLERLGDRLRLVWSNRPLSEAERSRADRLAESKYASDHWTRRRRTDTRPG